MAARGVDADEGAARRTKLGTAFAASKHPGE